MILVNNESSYTLFTVIRPGINVQLYTHCYNESVVPTLHFLAICASFGIKHKSTSIFKNPQVNIILEIGIKQVTAMLDLLSKSWHQQLLVLVALCVPNNHQCTVHSNTYYTVLTV
jgi:hypothetical protein